MKIVKKLIQILDKEIDNIVNYVDSHGYLLLIISLFLTMVVYPFIADSQAAGFWIHMLVSLNLITGFYTVSNHHRFLYQSFFLLVFTLVFSRIDYAFFENKFVALIYLVTGFLFFFYVTTNLIISLHNDDKVNAHLIFGTIAGYLLLGMLGAFIYAIIEILVPGSFSISMEGFNNLPKFIYYSFVNLTTLGYGDIIPLSPHAQSWSIMFTIAGEMYLVILIGVIVGKYVRKGSELI